MQKDQLSSLIHEYIEKRAQLRLEKFDKEAEKQRKDLSGNADALATLERVSLQQRADEVAKYEPVNWLTDAANRAKQISVVTHALKYTHSDAKGSSIYARATEIGNEVSERYVSTTRLDNYRVDVVGNAAALDVAGLLQLKVDGVSLIDAVTCGDSTALKTFTSSEEQLEEWMSGFKAASENKELSSHKLAKQVYFPVEKDAYHLLGPLYSSSMSQALYERISTTRFSDEAKAARKAKREEKYKKAYTVDYLNVAVQTFGGTKPQNVSLLNSGRGGKSYLLSSRPPEWETRKLPPLNHQDAFWSGYDRRAWRTARELKLFLLSVADRDSNLQIRNKRSEYVDELIGILLQYAAEIQTMTENVGWSETSGLPLAEQLWLDPHRSDESFQQQREVEDWQEHIASRFAAWLNHKLKDEKLIFKDVEYREWLVECLKGMVR